MYKYIKKIGDTESISEWKSKGFSDEVIKSSNNSLDPTVRYTSKRMYVKFSGSCLKQDRITFDYGKTVNIYIVYDLKSALNNFDPTLQNYLFGAVKPAKNSDIDKYKYSTYGIGFDSRRTFSHPSGRTGVNVIIFCADISSNAHANNKTKSILIIGEGFTQGLDDTTLYAEKIYSINFTVAKKKFCLGLHNNGDNSYLFVNATEIIKFKAKDSKFVANPLCLGNISEDFSVVNMRKTGLYGSVFDFSVGYSVTAVDDILEIRKYLMKGMAYNIKHLDLLKRCFLLQ